MNVNYQKFSHCSITGCQNTLNSKPYHSALPLLAKQQYTVVGWVKFPSVIEIILGQVESSTHC